MQNKEQHAKSSLKRYHKRRQNLIAQMGGKCARCGSTENLEFDHIDSNTKEIAISSHMSYKQETVKDELKKCQLLCHSCHVQKTKEEKDSNAKISSTDAANIRQEYITSNITQEKLGEKYGLKQSEIGNILRGSRWKHDGDDPLIQAKIDEKRKHNNASPKTSMAVDMIDPTTNTIIKTYNSMREAKRDGYKDNHIAECCRGLAKTHGGHKWQFHNKNQT